MLVQMHVEYLLSPLMYANMNGKMMQRTTQEFDRPKSSSAIKEQKTKKCHKLHINSPCIRVLMINSYKIEIKTNEIVLQLLYLVILQLH